LPVVSASTIAPGSFVASTVTAGAPFTPVSWHFVQRAVKVASPGACAAATAVDIAGAVGALGATGALGVVATAVAAGVGFAAGAVVQPAARAARAKPPASITFRNIQFPFLTYRFDRTFQLPAVISIPGGLP
jgi:hypothetical protein